MNKRKQIESAINDIIRVEYRRYLKHTGNNAMQATTAIISAQTAARTLYVCGIINFDKYTLLDNIIMKWMMI